MHEFRHDHRAAYEAVEQVPRIVEAPSLERSGPPLGYRSFRREPTPHRIRPAARRARRVALFYDATRTYDVKVMTGIADYFQRDDRLSIFVEGRALQDRRSSDLRSWTGDGIIANLDDTKVVKALMRSGLPAVGFGGGYGGYTPGLPIPYLSTNNRLIAAAAADHLIERGFEHLAFCGYSPTPVNGWSAEREMAFNEHVNACGSRVTVFHRAPATSGSWSAEQASLGDWLQALPKPVGIMAANDSLGREVLEACRNRELRVPDEVAVIGVDNDELLCRLSSPPLTSVEHGAARLGHAAAAMLDLLIDGRAPAERRVLIDPVGVVQRQSTGVLALDDPDTGKAMRFIREHASDPIGVPDVVRAAAVSRSTLEGRFRTSLHCTIRDAIRRAHLERARWLIANTALPLKQVVAESGFKTVQHMTVSFAKAFGQTPARYRRANS